MNDKQINCFFTLGQFNELHKAIDKARSNTQTIKVPKQALLNILMDHSTFYDVLSKDGYIFNEPSQN